MIDRVVISAPFSASSVLMSGLVASGWIAMPTPARAMSMRRVAPSCRPAPASLIADARQDRDVECLALLDAGLERRGVVEANRQLLAGGLLELRPELLDQRLGGVRAEDGEGLRAAWTMQTPRQIAAISSRIESLYSTR